MVELARVAAGAGFDTVSVTPAMFVEAVGQLGSDQAVADAVAATGTGVAMIDPLIRGLPGAPPPESVGRRFRATFEHGEEVVVRAARSLGAPAINVAHFLGAETPVEVLTDAIGTLADRVGYDGLTVLVEFMPEGSIPDLATASTIVVGAGRADVALTLDTWHLARTGEAEAELAALPEASIGAVQLADGPPALLGSWAAPPSAERLLPGAGVLQLDRTLAMVAARHPGAVVGVEVFDRSVRDQPPAERARSARIALRQVMGTGST